MKSLKALICLSVLTLSCHAFADANENGAVNHDDIRASKSFVATCPQEFLIYLDKAEGGPGAYCNCPETNMNYLDKAEGGPGFFCSK
jgi:hypothetical protein